MSLEAVINDGALEVCFSAKSAFFRGSSHFQLLDNLVSLKTPGTSMAFESLRYVIHKAVLCSPFLCLSEVLAIELHKLINIAAHNICYG
jgi:hypothetical protein